MADPLSADAFLAALRAEGVNVVEHDGWRTHNRNHKGPWGPVNGVVVHHTVSTGADTTVRICRDGYSELPGPLCHGVITKDGAFHLIGYGRTNHAGGGDPDTLAAVISEDYSVRPPIPNVGNSDGIDGNRHFYGWECENLGDGKDPWPDAQLNTIERASAAVCRAHGWTAKSVIGHLEWSDDKNDPRGFTMPWMRDRVAARLGQGPSTPPPPPAPSYAPFPGAGWFTMGRRSPLVAAMHDRLVAVGCNRYQSSRDKDVVGSGDKASYEAWQRKCGYTGAAATWPPGKSTWDRLQVPNV